MVQRVFFRFYLGGVQQFPDWFQVIFTSPITSAVIVVFILNLLFNHFGADRLPDDVPEGPGADEASALAPITELDDLVQRDVALT